MKILVVDDSSTFRMIARKELEQGGHEVIEATNGEEALKNISTDAFDLITMDVEMPNMNGYETFAQISSPEFKTRMNGSFQVPPALFVTSRDSLEERRKGFDVGAANYITKPFVPGELLEQANSLAFPDKIYEGLSVLIVDDSPSLCLLISEILKKEGMNIVLAPDGKEAVQLFRDDPQKFDLIISDYIMPEMSGVDLCRIIRKELNYPDIPIILMSGKAEDANILDMFKAGATDYIHKPFAKEELFARIKVHMEVRFKNIQLNNTVSKLKKLTTELDKASRTDPLTGLSNRRDIMETCQNEYGRLKRYDRPYSIIMCDIDHFKKVNDNHGHDAGDYVLTTIAGLFKGHLRECDHVARWGGEEFFILLPETPQRPAAMVAEKLRKAVESWDFLFQDKKLSITLSAGVVCHTDKKIHLEKMIKGADTLLYKAKNAGRNRVCIP